MGRLSIVVCMAILTLVASGCASVTGSSNQSVTVQARQQSGMEVVGASCELTNDEGKWFVNTPGSATIHRSNKTLQVLCTKDGFSAARTFVESKTKGAMWGNIILGGAVGAIVDHNSGAAYEYPTLIQIIMASLAGITSPVKTTTQQAEPQSLQATTTKEAPTPQSDKERLEELKRLYDEGLIRKNVYLDKQRSILSDDD